MKTTNKRICEDCGAEALDGRNRCRTNGCNGFIVMKQLEKIATQLALIDTGMLALVVVVTGFIMMNV